MPNFLSFEFLEPYKSIQPRNAGVLFYPVLLRTYCRFLPELKRRERWHEVVTRVVEYSISLYEGPASRGDLVREAELMFDKVFHLEVLPAGRTLWVGGTESARKFGESQFNCAAVTMDELENFGDLFQLLLCGCGVGFRILQEDVEKLPRLNHSIKVENLEYNYNSKHKQEMTTVYSDKQFNPLGNRWSGDSNILHMVVGDSREAWVQALREFFYYCENTEESFTIKIRYDYVRPEGSRIKSFGGRAPGPKGLMEMFTNLAEVVRRSGGKLSPVNVMDMCNFIAKNVIVGGTRRSSQIALGSPGDQEFIEAKQGLWITKQNLQRTMSNNSVTFEQDPTREQINQCFNGIKSNGEPGFINLKAMRERRPNANNTNPCSEIILDSKGFCNLTTINLLSFVQGKTFKIHEACQAIKMATRIGLRMTNVTVSLPKWDYVQKRDRLLGVSMTGVMDAFDALGWEFDSVMAEATLLSLRNAANSEADDYAFEMRIPRPLLVTCIKPEGTLTLLTKASSPGLHRSFAPFYIRRIRVSSMDPVASALAEMGVPSEPDQSKSERLVFSFPIRTDAKISAAEEPARRQFERYLSMMEHYVDHNASCTLTIGKDEWEEMEEIVYNNFDKLVGCAFLPKYTDAYPQMPYEEISREKYEELMIDFPDLNKLDVIVDSHEQVEYNEDMLEADCTSGVCPVR